MTEGPFQPAPPGPIPDWPLAVPPLPPPAHDSDDIPPVGWPAEDYHPYDANWPVPNTEFELFHHGSNFNPEILIDTSMTRTSGRSLGEIFDDLMGGGGRFGFTGNKGDVEDLLRQAVIVPSVHDVPGYDRRCGGDHACDFGEPWHVPGVPGSTRDRILQRDLSDVVTAPNGKVIGGWENDPYTGQRLDNPSQIQIDHVYPLQRAWDMGAADWTPQQRNLFANDPDNLLAVSGQANQDKSWSGPAEWLPPDKSEQLDYVERYLRVADKYHLPITDAERKAIQAVADQTTEGIGMAGAPTLEEIQNWNPKHLDDASEYHVAAAGNNTTTMDQIASSAAGTPWAGAGKDGLESVMAGHVGEAGSGAAIDMAGASAAKAAGEALSGSRSLLLESVDGAKDSQFDVGNDFSATDQNPLRAKYMPGLAQGVTEDLKSGAQAFGAQQQASATAITASHEATAGAKIGDAGRVQEDGYVEVFGPDGGPNYAVEHHDDGSITTGPGIPAMGGYWPDAAKVGGSGRGATMLDFRTGGGPDQTPPEGKGHLDGDGRCDDPEYQNGIERRFGASVIGGIIVGGLMGGPVGAISGGAGAGIGDIIHEITGDGPCQ